MSFNRLIHDCIEIIQEYNSKKMSPTGYLDEIFEITDENVNYYNY